MNQAKHAQAPASLAEFILDLPDRQSQADALAAAGQYTAVGLQDLLAEASLLMRTNPGQARRLAALCVELAPGANAAHLVPRATYLQAQAHALDGSFTPALALIQTARSGYQTQGDTAAALRTNVGLMHVLNEMGRHREAIKVGQSVLAQLESQADLPEAPLITALIHHNLGVCHRLTGQYAAALIAYEAAERHYRAADMPERLGDIFNNRGLILLHLGRVNEALHALQQAADIRREAGHTLLYAQTLINMGDAALQQGKFTRSLALLNEAHTLLESLDAATQQQILQQQRATVYLALNLLPEATEHFRAAVAQGRAAGMSHYTAQALWGLGTALTAAGQFAEADEALAEAAVLFTQAENAPLLAGVLLEQAALQARQGRRETAVSLAQSALQRVSGDRWPVQQLYAHLRLADLHDDDPQRAAAHLTAAEPLVEALPLPQLRYRWQQRIGRLRWQQEDIAAACNHLETAVAIIEQLRGDVAQEAMRISFLQDKVTAYDTLMQLYLHAGNRHDAFVAAERAKSRTLLDKVSSVQSDRLTGPAAADERLRALQADLTAVYNALLGDNLAAEMPVARDDLHHRAQELEASIRRLQLETPVETQQPFTTPLSYAGVRSRLPADVTLLAYHLLGDEIMAFVGQGDDLRAVRQVGSAAAVQQQLQRLNLQWKRFRLRDHFLQRHMPRLLATCRHILAELHAALFAPLRPHLPADGKLLIVPHDLLHQTPFHALLDGDTYLLDRYEISYAPSGTIAALTQRRRRRQAGKALIAGVADAEIPAVQAEIEAVAQQVGETAVLQNEAATTAAYHQRAPHSSLIHLACHGLFRADNPLFSALKLHDGWLTAADVLDTPLSGALVTLSACESGRGRVEAGDELLGLAWAFLGAGAATLVVSQWVAHDATTAGLMANWYANLRSGQPAAAALRAAQLALRESDPHPYYWAPFLLIGDRAGGW